MDELFNLGFSFVSLSLFFFLLSFLFLIAILSPRDGRKALMTLSLLSCSVRLYIYSMSSGQIGRKDDALKYPGEKERIGVGEFCGIHGTNMIKRTN